MSYLKGNGAPSNTLSASIGDIYINSKTGEQYECVFAYKCSGDDGTLRVSWSKLKETTAVQETLKKPEIETPEESRDKEPAEMGTSSEQHVNTRDTKSNRTNYSNYSKNKTR